MKKSYILLFLCFCFVSQAQNINLENKVNKKSRVILQSGTYSLPSISEITMKSLNNAERNQEKFIRVISGPSPLSPESWQRLNKAGIENNGYLPINSYLITLSQLNSKTIIALKEEGVTGMSVLMPEMKLSKQLADNNVPDYIWVGNKWELYIEGLPSIDWNRLQNFFKNLEIDLLGPQFEGVRILISPEKVMDLAKHPMITYIQQKEAPAIPENKIGIKNHRSNALRVPYAGGRNYDGDGIVVGHGDDGDIQPHIDFSGRVLANKSGPSNGAHGDHVAGTIMGAGNLDPDGEGQAPGSKLVYYDYPDNLNDIDTDYGLYGIRVTASSYSNGCNAGYTSFTRRVDLDAIQHPSLTHVFSAGNNGNSNCNYGAGSGWGNITGGHKQGKNVIATANVTGSDIIAGSSSRGPAHDGRIKPDIAALGTNVFSCLAPNDYRSITGTSMACPGIAGVLAQLYDAYRQNNNGADPEGGLMRALLTNNADDLGNPGPDFKYGYGRVNGLRAAKAIEMNWFIKDTIAQNETDTIDIPVPFGAQELRIMVHWTDPQATVNAGRALVNDLNSTLKLDASTWLPWVLNPTPNSTALNSNAVRAVDSLNNSEQFTLNQPNNGTYKLLVNGSSIPSGPQVYWVTWTIVNDEVELTYPIGGEVLPPLTTIPLRWDAPNGTGNFSLEFSSNGGNSFTQFATAPSSSRQSTFQTPNGVGDSLVFRISRGSASDITDAPIGLVGYPANLQLNWACPDSFNVSWNPVSNASGYVVYMLGQEYMNPIDTTINNSYTFYNVNPSNTIWWSVAALTPGGKVGKRAVAVEKTPGLQGCLLTNDVIISSILSPSNSIPDCQNTGNLPVSILIENGGLDSIFTVPMAYQFGNNAIVRDTAYVSLASTNTHVFTFSATVNAGTLGSYSVKVWAESLIDQNRWNDTLISLFEIVQSDSTYAMPYNQNFDNFSTCGTSNNCAGTICNLSGHMTNWTNGIQDDIDWRTNSGGTPSSGTGPSSGHTGGPGSDKYLYLEASSCYENTAILTTPCIDMTQTIIPELEFWSHMSGSSNGELHIDILSQGQWYNDYAPVINTVSGSNWTQQNISLAAFAGNIIVVRFRGKTGTAFSSDIAIDDISISEVTSAPTANFSISNSLPCLNQTIDLVDNSLNSPNQWLWKIIPNSGFSFMNGTDSTSQNPQVAFNTFGTYAISLNASNNFGSDSSSSSSVIVNGGSLLPFNQGFGNFLPSGWEIENPDNSTTWDQKNAIGSNGQNNSVAYISNINYNAPLQEDYLITPGIDLTGTSQPVLIFDVAYAEYNSNYSDGLRIDVSSNCGSSWVGSGYLKSGNVLATVPSQTGTFVPNSSGQWREDTVFLSTGFSGPSVKFRFAAINGYGNNLHIDNVRVYDLGASSPNAVINSSISSTTCMNDTVVFQAVNPGTAIASWDFGPGSIPSSANGVGPHSVIYFSSGSKSTTLSLTNSGGTDIDTLSFNINQPVSAGFTYGISGQTVSFSDNSSGSPTQWNWDFGDGSSSSLQSPTHSYPSSGGSYNVSLASYNDCGWDSTGVLIQISGVGNDETMQIEWSLLPNPSQDIIKLIGPRDVEIENIEVIDALGRIVFSGNLSSEKTLNIKTLALGQYLMRISAKGTRKTISFIKN